MPYFSYTTCLHLYETLGWWRTGGLRLIHFAEEWNELHHLLIMEALGGDRRWQDRFLGQHCAVFYYWALVISFLISPKWSYKFSEMLESALRLLLYFCCLPCGCVQAAGMRCSPAMVPCTTPHGCNAMPTSQVPLCLR